MFEIDVTAPGKDSIFTIEQVARGYALCSMDEGGPVWCIGVYATIEEAFARICRESSR